MYVRNITNVHINFSKNFCFTIMSFWQCHMSTHVLWPYWSHNCFFFPFCRYTSCNYLLLYWYSFNDQWVICGLSYGHGWKVMTGPLETYWRLHTCRCLYQYPLSVSVKFRRKENSWVLPLYNLLKYWRTNFVPVLFRDHELMLVND